MAKTKPLKPSAGAATSLLLPHLLTLAQQASEQLTRLALTIDAHMSLETDVDPVDEDEALTPPASTIPLTVLRRALKTELRQQLKALAITTETLYSCAERAARRQQVKPTHRRAQGQSTDKRNTP